MRPVSLKLISRVFSVLMVFALLSTPVMIVPVSAAPGDLTRVSVDSAGSQANGNSLRPAISDNGRFVAFASAASNLISGDTNNVDDIFVKDRQTGAITRVSVSSNGAEANGGSTSPAISADGRFVAFYSDASNLVSGDTNGVADIFVHDRQNSQTTRVSVDSSGVEANAPPFHDNFVVSISGDGRFVAYYSDASNLVSGDTNGVSDIFVYDRQTGQTRRASVASNGSQGDASSRFPNLSSDGRYVTFASSATNLTAGDINGRMDIFVNDLQTGSTTMVSVNTRGAQADGISTNPDISGDGRYVVFLSGSGNIDPRADEYFGKDLVYVHDRQTGQTTLASVDSDGSILTVGLFDQPTISRDGRYVAFSFYDKGNNNGILHIWFRDLQRGESRQVAGGSASAGHSTLSSDGSFVAFNTTSNLGSGDTNGVSDVFVGEALHAPERNPTVAAAAPECGFSRPLCTYPTQASVSFTVLFSEMVSGVTADDFTLDMLEGISGASITGISGSGDQYIVTINTGTGDGKLRLNVVDNDSIVDTALNPLGGVGVGNGNFSKVAGFLYIVDKNSPAVTNIVRADPNPTTATEVRFTVSFSELVYPVNAGDFVLSTTGGISGAAITGIVPREDQFTAAATYTVTVNTGTGDGTLRLDLIDDDSILDNNRGNPLGGAGVGNGSFTTGEAYTINRNTPLVTSSLRAGPSPTEAASVNFTVNFSQAVTGVDTADFALTTGGISGALVTNVSGSGTTYTVTVGTGSGNGDLRLDVVDNDTILNASSFPLGGAGTGNGNFTTGESYTVQRSNPIANSITRMDPNPSSAQTVNFRLTLSEPVSGVDISDFAVNVSGISGASLIAVNGSGNSYAVTVGTGSGNGSLRLDLIDNDSILDLAGNPLGGAGAGNGNLNGETYTINKTTVTYFTEKLRSTGSNDGWVLESNENSNVGGTINAIDPTFRLGDSAKDQQYKVILHFPTEGLPDNAVITSAILTLKRKGVTGTNPFTTHGNILIDIATGNFGFDSYLGSYALQPLDFQAPSTLNNVGTIQNNPVGDVYWSLLSGDGNRFINLKGVTQLRLAFQLDDNDDLGEDLFHFFSGDAKQLLDRPHLQIEYYVIR
jgi:Tol biopolymer transport system component